MNFLKVTFLISLNVFASDLIISGKVNGTGGDCRLALQSTGLTVETLKVEANGVNSCRRDLFSSDCYSDPSYVWDTAEMFHHANKHVGNWKITNARSGNNYESYLPKVHMGSWGRSGLYGNVLAQLKIANDQKSFQFTDRVKNGVDGSVTEIKLICR